MNSVSQTANLLRRRFPDLLERSEYARPSSAVVVQPTKPHILASLAVARELGLIEPILVGHRGQIAEAAEELPDAIDEARIIDVADGDAALDAAIEMVSAEEADVLIKGSVHTDLLMRAVIRSYGGLANGRRMSHVFACFVPKSVYHKPLFITDGALNIAPDVGTKWQIIRNSVELLHGFGVAKPKIAILAATENVLANMAATLDAAALSVMGARLYGADAIIDGPLALDVALSLSAARVKDLRSEVAGDPDVLVVPSIETGNALVKLAARVPSTIVAGFVIGGRYPIVLPSRADSLESRVMACALATAAASTRTTPQEEKENT